MCDLGQWHVTSLIPHPFPADRFPPKQNATAAPTGLLRTTTLALNVESLSLRVEIRCWYPRVIFLRTTGMIDTTFPGRGLEAKKGELKTFTGQI